MAVWLLIIDAINPLAYLDIENLDRQEWTYYFLILAGLIMGVFGGICALLILLWTAGRCAGLTLCIAVFIAAVLRIVAVTVGFENFVGGVKKRHMIRILILIFPYKYLKLIINREDSIQVAL